jgi:hypothetical protein
MKLFVGMDFKVFSKEGSMGVVTDTMYVNCIWPKLDAPTRLFAEGSSGIVVMGSPTPRNVWFPDDVQFSQYYPDAMYPAELAVKEAFPNRRTLINLSPAEAEVWQEAYLAKVSELPVTATIFETERASNFLRYKEEISRRLVTVDRDIDVGGAILKAGSSLEKIEYEEFVAELTPKECSDLMSNKIVESDLRSSKSFLSIRDGKPLIALQDVASAEKEAI